MNPKPTVAEAVAGVVEHRRQQARRQERQPTRAEGATKPGTSLPVVDHAPVVERARNPHMNPPPAAPAPIMTSSEEEAQLAEFLRSRGFPARAIQASRSISPASFTGEDTFIDGIEALLEGGRTVAVIGNNGTGKTALSTMIARRWRKRHPIAPPAYSKAAFYVGQMRHDCYTRKTCSEREWIESETRRIGLLVLDELDKSAELEKTTASTFLLESIIDARYEALDRPTIVIANFTEKAFKEKVPASIRDRIVHGGDPIELTGESWRRQA